MSNRNARLASKAPDLLYVVKQLMDEYRPDAAFDEYYYPIWALADAIINYIEPVNPVRPLTFRVSDCSAFTSPVEPFDAVELTPEVRQALKMRE
jgi:hypothetical protein